MRSAQTDPCHGYGAITLAPLEPWPWEAQWWKCAHPRRTLVKAAALLIAEIERLDRLELKTSRR